MIRRMGKRGAFASVCALALWATGAAGPGAAATDARGRVPGAVEKAAGWLAAFPIDGQHYDAAVGLAAIRRTTDSEGLRIAFERARRVADRDADNPMRRAFDETYRAPAEHTSRWAIPGPGQPRVNVNRVVEEALFCAENGLRPETLAYATGPMRDGGGYFTAHAIWALVLARDRGCLRRARFDRLARPLLDELLGAQPPRPEEGALAADLFAERLLMLVLAGERGARIDAWAAALLDAQAADGGFGSKDPDEDPYHGYHATLVSSWALVEWAARPGAR